MPIRYICSNCGSILYENVVVDGVPVNILYGPSPKTFMYSGLFSPSEVRFLLNSRCPFCGKPLSPGNREPRISLSNSISMETLEIAWKVVKELNSHGDTVEKVVKVLKVYGELEFMELVEKVYGTRTQGQKRYIRNVLQKLCRQGLVEVYEHGNRLYIKARTT